MNEFDICDMGMFTMRARSARCKRNYSIRVSLRSTPCKKLQFKSISVIRISLNFSVLECGIARNSDETILRNRDYCRMSLLWLIARVIFESKGGRKREGARGGEKEKEREQKDCLKHPESENQRMHKYYLC